MTIREHFNLEYDTSGFGSGLIEWYNTILDKSVNELTAMDVRRLLRQNFIEKIAICKAIELFIANPFDGEFSDGDLLETIIEHWYVISQLHIDFVNLKMIVEQLFETAAYEDFEWDLDENKEEFVSNLKLLKEKIALLVLSKHSTTFTNASPELVACQKPKII